MHMPFQLGTHLHIPPTPHHYSLVSVALTAVSGVEEEGNVAFSPSSVQTIFKHPVPECNRAAVEVFQLLHSCFKADPSIQSKATPHHRFS